MLDIMNEIHSIAKKSSDNIRKLLKKIDIKEIENEIKQTDEKFAGMKSRFQIKESIKYIKKNRSQIRWSDEKLEMLKKILKWNFNKRDILEWYEWLRHPRGMCPDDLQDEYQRKMALLKWVLDKDVGWRVLKDGWMQYKLDQEIYEDWREGWDDTHYEDHYEEPKHNKIKALQHLKPIKEAIDHLEWDLDHIRKYPVKIKKNIKYIKGYNTKKNDNKRIKNS